MQSIKVLFVRPSLGQGGADRVTLNILKHYDRTKYEVSLALMKAQGEFLQDVPSDVRIINLKSRNLGTFSWPLSRLLKNENFDVVYSTCSGASMSVTLAAILCRFQGKVVVSERNTLFHTGKNKLKRWTMVYLKRLLYRRADWVTVVSNQLVDHVIHHLRVPRSKVRVVNNPIVDSRINDLAIQSKLIFPRNSPRLLLSVGRLETQKNHALLLKAFSTLVANNKDARLIILGSGPLLQDLQGLAKRLRIDSFVEFKQFDKNPFDLIAKADVFVLTSFHEGMPGVLIQALGCATPCISTDCPTGPSELIKNGLNGFLVPVNDPDSLASKLNELLNSPQLSSRFAQEGPHSVSRFRVDAATDSYFDFLHGHG